MHVCIFLYKCLNDLYPSNISELVTQNYKIHLCNTRRKNDLHLPKMKLERGNIINCLIELKRQGHFLVSKL